MAAFLTAASPCLSFRLGVRGQAQELLKAMLAAKVGCLTVAFGVEGGVYIHGHATDRVDSFGAWWVHKLCWLILFYFGSGFKFRTVRGRKLRNSHQRVARCNGVQTHLDYRGAPAGGLPSCRLLRSRTGDFIDPAALAHPVATGVAGVFRRGSWEVGIGENSGRSRARPHEKRSRR